LKHSPLFRLLAIAACAAALYSLYFFELDGCGLLSKDEPRYAAIGLEMAHSGDFVMPVLWGQPWFEKPPLLYWMTAAAARMGVPGDLAPRLPVASLGAVFVAVYFAILAREFGSRVALFAAAILGTSAGWLAYSRIAVTDVPLSATFAAGMLLLMRPAMSFRRALVSGVLIGLATLAKGLVPFVLLLPAIWFRRREIRALLLVIGVALAVAAPWYAAVTLRAGRAFFDEFIWKQHFARFVSDISQHVQPWWYYAPVLLAGLAPWTPLIALVRRRLFDDGRARFLLVWFLWGLVFFSASRNKLPGYVLPLLPAAAVLLALALDAAPRAWAALTLGASAALLYVFPLAERVLPSALTSGIRHATVAFAGAFPRASLIAVGLVAIAVAALELRGARMAAVLLVSAGVTIGVVHFVVDAYPVLDQRVSTREVWRSFERRAQDAAASSMKTRNRTPAAPVVRGVVEDRSRPCIASGSWEFRYGLSYYFGFAVPDCSGAPGEVPLRPAGS